MTRLPGVLLPLVVLGGPCSAAEIVADGNCSLVEAIQAANTDTVVGLCAAGSGADTIVLTADVVLTSAFSGENGLPTISSNISIEGQGHEIRRESAEPFRILEISDTLTARSVGLRGGFLSGTSCGAGLLVSQMGIASIIDSSIVDHRVINTDDPFTGGFGAGICNYGVLTLRSSTISGNSTDPDSFGTGIYNEGTLDLANSTISSNTTDGGSDVGSGLLNFGGTATVRHCTFSGHHTNLDGGSIFSVNGTVHLANTIVEGLPSGGAVCLGAPTDLVDSGGNLQFPGTSCGAGIPSLDPLLLGLGDNGGATATHLPAGGSPAIDSALLAACLAEPIGGLDQRGAARGFDEDGVPNSPETGDCDIGAAERRGFELIFRSGFETGGTPDWTSTSGLESEIDIPKNQPHRTPGTGRHFVLSKPLELALRGPAEQH